MDASPFCLLTDLINPDRIGRMAASQGSRIHCMEGEGSCPDSYSTGASLEKADAHHGKSVWTNPIPVISVVRRCEFADSTGLEKDGCGLLVACRWGRWKYVLSRALQWKDGRSCQFVNLPNRERIPILSFLSMKHAYICQTEAIRSVPYPQHGPKWKRKRAFSCRDFQVLALYDSVP